MLLQNNNNALPIQADHKAAAFGVGFTYFTVCGYGSGSVCDSSDFCLPRVLNQHGITTDQEVDKHYGRVPQRRSSHPCFKRVYTEISTNPLKIPAIAARNDVALICIQRLCGEYCDRPIEDDYEITSGEMTMISDVSTEFHKAQKPVVLLLNIGGPVNLSEIVGLVDAILVVWQCGKRSGEMIAEVLTGRQNPSGRLPMTFLRSIEDSSAVGFPGEENPEESKFAMKTIYAEGIYVGYRYYDTFGIEPLFPFGYGLSYTTFNIEAESIVADSEKLRFQGRVVNTGNVPGKEVVQLYVAGPQDARLDIPEQELRGFAKTWRIEAGKDETVEIEVNIADLASFDEVQHCWVVLAGPYEARVGNSSRSISIRHPFVIPEEIRLKNCANVLAPKEPIEPPEPIAARVPSSRASAP